MRSQTLYLGVAYAMGEDTPDTLILATPDAPYVCVGFHQDPALELDLDFCAGRDIPVLRREIPGLCPTGAATAGRSLGV